ncbi:hypothetical protein BGZ82_010505 [Podila clonocystis]|nr:hypothetical protein BGZ82_010505 [Podila clonocystis]
MKGAFVRALGGTYHLECFKCMDCSEIVASKFFPITEKDGKQYPLCERDYFRRLNLVCQSCGGALRGSYITALDYKYHIEHFTCSVCPTVFGPQDSYYEHDSKVYCHYHYSLCYAVKCAGCRTAILKQFVEINRNSQDEHWHPECYMIHKFWNVKLSFTPQIDDKDKDQLAIEAPESDLLSPNQPTSPTELRTPAELKLAQQQMEEKVYQIWTVLSAFEESSAGCISEMLLHVSNGAYYDGVQMAGKFILHVDILFSAIDDLETQMKEVGDQSDMAHGREAKMLCKKIVNFFSLLSHTQESGVRRLGMTQELLSLVTGLAHYLKILIRIALTCALKLERQYNSTFVIARFLNKLMELANRDKYLNDLHGKSSMDAEVTSDLCFACRVTIEDECYTFNHHHRWHPKCLICSGCAKPQASAYYDASFDASRGSVLCQQCRTPESQTGFSHVTKLEQYTFLLRVALIRLENLLHLKGDESQAEGDPRVRQLATSPTSNPLSPPGLMRKDSRSKSYSSDDNRQYETIHLGDIKRVKSTHLDRKLSNSARIPRRQTVIEHQRRRAPPSSNSARNLTVPPEGVQLSDNAVGGTEAEPAALEIEIVDDPSAESQDEDDLADVDGPSPDAPATLSDLTERLRISTANLTPNSHGRVRLGHGSAPGSQYLAVPNALNASRHPKRQYLSELSALELFIVKHLAVLTLAPIVQEYFTLEELLDLIGQRKQTLWGRFVKGLKTDKKKSKVEGTFGVPLEVLVERNGVDSALGAGPGRIRIPSFVDDSISAMRNMASFSHVDEETGSKMDLHNLATVITPNVLYSKSKDPTKDESFLAIESVMGLLEYQDDFCVVPMDLSSILSDQDLVESSTDLSSKDILKRCENLVKSKVKKSHSLGDLYADTPNNNEGVGDVVGSGTVNGSRHMHYQQQGHHHHNHHSAHQEHHTNGHTNPSSVGPVKIPERPRPYQHSHSSHAVVGSNAGANANARGSTPMSL